MAKKPKDAMAQIGKTRVRVPERELILPPGFPKPIGSLSSVSDADLTAELTRRQAAKEQTERMLATERQDEAMRYIDTLILFAPEHETNNCTDENTDGAYLDHGIPRCNRCFLLNAKETEYWHASIDVQVLLLAASFQQEESDE